MAALFQYSGVFTCGGLVGLAKLKPLVADCKPKNVGSVAGSRRLPGCTNSSFLCVSPETVRTDQGHPPGQGLEDRTRMGEVGTVVRGRRTRRSPPCNEWKVGKVGRAQGGRGV